MAYSQNGTVLPVAELTIDFDAYELWANSSDNQDRLVRRGEQLPWLKDVTVAPLANVPLLSSYSSLNESLRYEKRTNMRQWVYYVAEAGKCAYEYWDIADGLWQLGYDVYRLVSTNNCEVINGSRGSFYYKYYPVEGRCSATIHQKTIAGAIQQALRTLEGDYLCNTYLFHVDHHGTRQGDIIVGSSPSLWVTTRNGVEFKGFLDAGCSGLQSPYTCDSKEEGS